MSPKSAMRQWGRSGALVVALVPALAMPATAIGHVRKASGPYTVELGWADEPAYSGVRNAIEVGIEDAAGHAIVDPRASLRVEVSFGETQRELTLAASAERYAAAIIPTQPGEYAFHVTGTVRGRAVDVAAACSERTFDCVASSDEIEFPVAEPSASELSLKLDRATARAKSAEGRGASAQTIAALVLVVAVVALLAAALLARRRNRRE